MRRDCSFNPNDHLVPLFDEMGALVKDNNGAPKMSLPYAARAKWFFVWCGEHQVTGFIDDSNFEFVRIDVGECAVFCVARAEVFIDGKLVGKSAASVPVYGSFSYDKRVVANAVSQAKGKALANAGFCIDEVVAEPLIPVNDHAPLNDLAPLEGSAVVQPATTNPAMEIERSVDTDAVKVPAHISAPPVKEEREATIYERKVAPIPVVDKSPEEASASLFDVREEMTLEEAKAFVWTARNVKLAGKTLDEIWATEDGRNTIIKVGTTPSMKAKYKGLGIACEVMARELT